MSNRQALHPVPGLWLGVTRKFPVTVLTASTEESIFIQSAQLPLSHTFLGSEMFRVFVRAKQSMLLTLFTHGLNAAGVPVINHCASVTTLIFIAHLEDRQRRKQTILSRIKTATVFLTFLICGDAGLNAASCPTENYKC